VGDRHLKFHESRDNLEAWCKSRLTLISFVSCVTDERSRVQRRAGVHDDEPRNHSRSIFLTDRSLG
jgi:hypothetical protein